METDERKRPRRALSIRTLLVLLVVMTSIPPLLVLGWVGYSGRQRTVDLVSTTAADFATGLALSYAMVDDIATSYMKRLREQPSVETLDYVRCNRMFQERMTYEYLFSDILLTTATGEVLASGRTDTPTTIAPILKSIPRLNEKIYRGELFAGKPYKETVIPYVQGLHSDSSGKPQFALILLLKSTVYSSVAGKIEPPQGINYSLLDRSGCFIFRYPAPTASEKGEAIYPGIWEQIKTSRDDHGSLYIDELSGMQRFFGYTRLRGDGEAEPYMTVFTSLLQKEAVANVSRTINRSIVLVLACIACIAAAALYLGRRYVVLPLKKLVGATRRFAEGDMSQQAEEDGFPDEIAILARAFDDMALAIEQRVRLGRSIEVEVREQANKDFLTGAFNRRAGLSILGNTRELSLSNKYPFAIIFIDLDRFKSINDTYGHAEGDVLLKRVSGLLISHLRADDILCRYGGDEFLIVLPHCDRQGVMEAWARIQESVTQINRNRELPYEVSLSHGKAVFDPEKPVSLDALIEVADKAMYQDKENRKKPLENTKKK